MDLQNAGLRTNQEGAKDRKMKKNKHIQSLTLELRDSRNDKEWDRQRVSVFPIEFICSPYPWPDTLMVIRSRNNAVVEYRITAAIASAAQWESPDGDKWIATREVEV
jgi:phosphoribosylaminoimidazole-succinocarboxamide synthase